VTGHGESDLVYHCPPRCALASVSVLQSAAVGGSVFFFFKFKSVY